MTKSPESISYDELAESELLLKKNKMNFLSESEEENETNMNSVEDKEETKEKTEDKRYFNQCHLPKKNFILKSEFYKNLKNKEDKYFNITNKENNPIINYYANTNIIQLNNNVNCLINLDINTSEKNKEIFEIEQFNNINKDKEIFSSNLSNKENNEIYQKKSYNNYNNLFEKNKDNKDYNISNNNYNQSQNINQINPPLINYIFNFIKTNNYIYTNMNNIVANNAFNSEVSIIKDKYGCMMMKNKIILNPNYANEILFSQIKNNLTDLCCDNFGNYFLQTFLDVISFENLSKFFDLINKDFTIICMSPQGTRVIQKIIDKISFIPMLINKFIFILNNKDFGLICKSLYGNHIIQKYLVTFHSFEYTFFIYKYVFENFIDITNSKHGVFIVQKCISEGNEKHRERLYKLIIDNLLTIIQNEFGNYLIQFILLNNRDVENTFPKILPIINKIEEHIIDLCISKYSANVIEKCFENSDNIIRNHILDSLFNNNGKRISELFFNKYGIYVILKAVKSQDGKYKSKIIELLDKYSDEFQYSLNLTKKNYKKIIRVINNNKELDDIYKTVQNNINNEKIEFQT